MSTLVLQDIMGARFRTSAEAAVITKTMQSHLGISTHAGVARLAIGRSLALPAFTTEPIDSKGMEIAAAILFSQDDIASWVGLIVTHAQFHKQDAIDSMDTLRAAVRKHWHRGVLLLQKDWAAADGNYDKFVDTLITRRATPPDIKAANGTAPKVLKPVENSQQDMSSDVRKALSAIGVTAEMKGLTHGPRISRYHLHLPDVNQYDKLRKGLERLGIALGLQKKKPVLSAGNGPSTLDLDLPRPPATWTPVSYTQFREWVSLASTKNYRLPVFPGVDAMGTPYSFDLAAAPHLLVGGTPGSGKSVCLHALILSLMSSLSSSALKIALIDPKQVEYAVYRGSPYLYRDEVATTSSEAQEVLDELVTEMEARYAVFGKNGVSNIQEAHRKHLDMPYIVLFIEEVADLIMLNAGHEAQMIRLAQKSRAAGIHLVLATQRPDAKTFAGLLRSNIPARIALTVQKSSESIIILDQTGAEDLLGAGDMLVKANPGNKPDRVQGVNIERSDIEMYLKSR